MHPCRGTPTVGASPHDSPELKPRPVQRRHHRLPVQPAALPSPAALPEVFRGRCPVPASPAAIAAGPEREAYVVAVCTGAVPVVGPPADAATAFASGARGGDAAFAPARGLRQTPRGRSGGGGRGGGDDYRWVAGASDLCGPTTLLVYGANRSVGGRERGGHISDFALRYDM